MPENPTQPAIEVTALVKTYAGVTAVNNISFTVPRGEIIGFLGPNGAGKSTTMRILTGYLPATSGQVSICGYPVAIDPDAVKRRVGYMPENNPLPEEMRVSEYLYFRGRLKEVPRRKLGSRIDEVLELCDLKRVRHKIIGKLSKGFRQRVGIAESVLAEPPVIIMDELTIGLDPHQILIVRDLIASLRGRMTVLISSHILPEIEMTCDRVLIINQGRIVAQGTPAELRREVLGQSAYEIQAAGPLGSLLFLLGAIDPGLSIASEGAPDKGGFRTITLKTLNDEDTGEAILRACMSEGLRVRSISRAHPTLEDVFLAATRRSWDSVAEDPKGENQRMKHFFTILSHEIRMLLVSPSTYIAGVAFLWLMGFIFTGILEQFSKASQSESPAAVFFTLYWFPVIFMVPLLTMKCLAEERRMGTIETLLTTPVTTTEVVLGKYAAAYLLYLTFWASTSGLFYILKRYAGDAHLIDPGPIIGGYLFIAVSGLFFVAIGVFASALSRNQAVAGILCTTILIAIILGGRYLASAAWLDRESLAPLKAAVDYAQISRHFEDFTRGVVDTRELLFYVSGTVLALIFSILSVEAKLLHS